MKGTVNGIWTLPIGEELIIEAEDRNEHGKHAVAVRSDGLVQPLATNQYTYMWKDVKPSTGTRHLFKIQHLLALGRNLHLASKPGRCLFKGNVY